MSSYALTRTQARQRWPLTETHWAAVIRLLSAIFVTVAVAFAVPFGAGIWALHIVLTLVQRKDILMEVWAYLRANQDQEPKAHLQRPYALSTDRVLILLFLSYSAICML